VELARREDAHCKRTTQHTEKRDYRRMESRSNRSCRTSAQLKHLFGYGLKTMYRTQVGSPQEKITLRNPHEVQEKKSEERSDKTYYMKVRSMQRKWIQEEETVQDRLVDKTQKFHPTQLNVFCLNPSSPSRETRWDSQN
jgi:hypothetical protein